MGFKFFLLNINGLVLVLLRVCWSWRCAGVGGVRGAGVGSASDSSVSARVLVLGCCVGIGSAGAGGVGVEGVVSGGASVMCSVVLCNV